MARQAPERRTRGRPRSTPSGEAPTTVQALDRGLTLLALLAESDGATLTELALRADMAPSTVHRMLATLQSHGLVALDEDTQTWLIGVETFRIGSAFARHANYLDVGRKLMHSLMEETGETANMAIAVDAEVVFVSQVECHEPIRAFFQPGTRGYLHATGIGKALLAEMPRRQVRRIVERKGLPAFTPKTITASEELFDDLARIRERGWAMDDEERTLGMRCLAAPIFNEYGEAVAGISISGPAVRLGDSILAEVGPKVRAAAREVTARIGGVEP